jgi:hypothetical protein
VAICSLPPDKAPGPDGFTARVLQATWELSRPDEVWYHGYHAYWTQREGTEEGAMSDPLGLRIRARRAITEVI